MKVYAVWEGEFSDKKVIAIFSDPKTAHFYSMLGDNKYEERYVEEYELDKPQMEFTQKYVYVKYYFGSCKEWIESVKLCNKAFLPRISKQSCVEFEFTLSLSDRNAYTALTTEGKDSKWLLKVTQDKLAQYFYEHNTTKEKQMKKEDKKWAKKNKQYKGVFYNTSIQTKNEPTPIEIANDRVTKQMHAMVINGEELPDDVKLKEMFDKALADVKAEQEEKK